MPRKNLIRTNEHPYHVTIRCNNKEWFDLPLKEVWRICLQSLGKAKKKNKVNIQAFVLMGNHYHLMIWTPESNLDSFMWDFNSEISREIRSITGRINRIFGDRYRWSLITTSRYQDQALKYIYQNPIRANIVEKCEDYEFSTLKSILKKGSLGFELYWPTIGDLPQFLEWINYQPQIEETEKIKKALSKPIFKIPIDRTSRRNL
ncbi:unnamed protein product [Chrysoparadoxa australica]